MDANTAHATQAAGQGLPAGTNLSEGQFTTDGVLGAGSFGINYRATDNVLRRTVVIKECFPAGFCVRQGLDVYARSDADNRPIRSIVQMFLREAQSLAKLRHPSIVAVHRVFEENGTAYMVLDLIEGRVLSDILAAKNSRLSPSRVIDILLQLLDAIEAVHGRGLLHREISPDNILLETNGTPVLIGFGAAQADASHPVRKRSATPEMADRYAPPEFHESGSEQSPRSDLFALAATFYHVISGEAPVGFRTRSRDIAREQGDPYKPLAGRFPDYDDEFLQAIDTAMKIDPAERLQSAAKWRLLIENTAAIRRAASGPATRPSSQRIPLDLEMSLSRLVEETNDEVRKTSRVPEASKPKAPPPPQSKPAPKPAWIDEFNRESLAPEPVRAAKTSFDKSAADARDDIEDDGWTDVHHARINSKSASAETNWIDRAMEKQDRIRSEREHALMLAETDDPEALARDEGDDFSEAPALDADAPDEKRNFNAVGILVGLLIGLLCVFFLPGQ